MTPVDVTARRLWWLDTGVTGYAGFRPGFNRSTLVAGIALVAGVWFVAAFFRRAGLAASRPGGSLANVAFLLVAWQVLCFAGTRPGWRAGLFQDPPGPLLPYRSRQRLALWTMVIAAPIALGLAAAYAGVSAGLRGLSGRLVVAAWLVDVAALSTLALGLDACRWLFRTYAPLPIRRAWALLGLALVHISAVGFGVLCFVVALQFGLRQIFLSESVTALMRHVAVSIATRPEAAPLRDALRVNTTRFEGFDSVSAMSLLVTEGRAPTAIGSLVRGAALAAVLLIIAVVPGRRPEEQDPIRRFAHMAGEWATSVTVHMWPRRFRVSWRLMLPPLYVAMRYVAVAGVVLTTTAFFLTLDRVSPVSMPERINRVLTGNGAFLAMLLAFAHVPLANGLGVRAADYVRYVTLPMPTEQLLRRMLLAAIAGGALLDALVAITWSLVIQRAAATSLLFAAAVVSLLVTALCGYVGVAAAQGSRGLRVASIFARGWAIVPAAILIWLFQLLRRGPEMLPSVAAIGVVASIVAGLAAWAALGRMVATREPTAGL